MDTHDYTNMEAYPWVDIMMRKGHWELMPLLSASAKVFRDGLCDSHYREASKKGLKVKGAISIFRMKAEHARFRKRLVGHLWNMRGDVDSLLTSPLKDVLHKYQDHVKDFPDWTGDLSYTLQLERSHWTPTIYHVIQTGVLLAYFGMIESTMFKVLASRMDVAIAWMHDNVMGKRLKLLEKFTFQDMIKEIMTYEEKYKFIYYFCFNMNNIRIPLVERFIYLWDVTSRIVNFRVVRSLPSFVRGSVATICFMGKTAMSPFVLTNTIRARINAYEDYMR